MEPATLDSPDGRIQVTVGSRFVIGTKFMNVDLARMLDEEYGRTHQSGKPGPEGLGSALPLPESNRCN